MANFGWAYVNCTDESSAGTGGGTMAGPTGSVQFLTGANATDGVDSFVYHTASVGGHPPSTLILSGNLIVTGTVSASVFQYRDITVIDTTGSTFFGDTNDDVHIRTGSFVVARTDAHGLTPTLSASAVDGWVKVRGFAAEYYENSLSTFDLGTAKNAHIIGLRKSTAQTLNVPAASDVPIGFIWTIKDEVTSRTGAGNNITLTSSSPIQNLFDGEPTYVLTGTMPAISLYSNGVNWFIF